VAVLKHPDNEYELNQWNVIERAAQALGITAEPVTVRSAAQFEEAFATVRQSHPDGLIATLLRRGDTRAQTPPRTPRIPSDPSWAMRALRGSPGA
jgi:hypothetical protein